MLIQIFRVFKIRWNTRFCPKFYFLMLIKMFLFITFKHFPIYIKTTIKITMIAIDYCRYTSCTQCLNWNHYCGLRRRNVYSIYKSNYFFKTDFEILLIYFYLNRVRYLNIFDKFVGSSSKTRVLYRVLTEVTSLISNKLLLFSQRTVRTVLGGISSLTSDCKTF